jgi:ribosomal protein L37AE/L43A
MATEKRISLVECQERFGTEQQCRDYLLKKSWPSSFVCPKCAAKQHCVLANGMIQCGTCRHQTSVTAGTIMHRTHVPLTKWFLAMYFVSQDKRGISAVQLKSTIGVTYKTAWYVLARIREAMGQRDDTHQLNGVVEFDDTFFGGPTVGKKRGRGTEK